MPEVANGINTWKKSSTCFWLPSESFIKIVLTLFSLFVELVCQQPHDQYSDQRSDNSQKYRICLDCSRHSHLDRVTSSGFCNAKWVSALARQGHTPARSTALPELHSAGKRKQKYLLFTAIPCSCSGDFSILFLLPQGAHIGIALPCSVAGELRGLHRACQESPLVLEGLPRLTSNPPAIRKKHAQGSGKYGEWLCGVKVVVTYCRKIVPTTVSFQLERKKGGQFRSFSLPLRCPRVGATAAMLLASPPYPSPPATHQSFSPKKASVCVCVRRSESMGNKQILLQEVFYPHYLSCGFTSRP